MKDEPPRAMPCAFPAINVLASVAAIALGIWLFSGLSDVLLLCFAGALLGVFLHGTGSWLAQRVGVRSRAMVGAFCLFLGGAAAITAWLAAPSVATQVDQLVSALPGALERASEPLERFSWGRAVLERVRDPDDIIARRDTWSRAGGVISSALGGIGSLFVVLFVGLFTAFDPELYVRGFLRLVPSGQRTRVGGQLTLIAHTLQMWMIGKLLSMAVIGIATWVGLVLLKIPLALVLALLAAVLTFIPNFGPVLSAIPAILLALVQGSTQAIWVIGLYVGIQTVESYILTPMMQKKMVSLPPALTLVAQVVMGTLAGGLGLVVATPLMAAVLVVVKDVLGSDEGVPTAGHIPKPE